MSFYSAGLKCLPCAFSFLHGTPNVGSWLANTTSPFARFPIKPIIGEEKVLFHPPSHKSHTFP